MFANNFRPSASLNAVEQPMAATCLDGGSLIIAVEDSCDPPLAVRGDDLSV
jgi:hypothetical protein